MSRYNSFFLLQPLLITIFPLGVLLMLSTYYVPLNHQYNGNIISSPIIILIKTLSHTFRDWNTLVLLNSRVIIIKPIYHHHSLLSSHHHHAHILSYHLHHRHHHSHNRVYFLITPFCKEQDPISSQTSNNTRDINRAQKSRQENEMIFITFSSSNSH